MDFYLNRSVSLSLVRKVNFLLIIVVIFEFILFPAPILAQEVEETTEMVNIIKLSYLYKDDAPLIVNTLPENPDREVKTEGYYTVTAYNSEVGQCDDTPCITANGFNLCEHGIEDSIATNMLPFGTKVRLPELFGDRVFVVRDRMNARYYARFDVWMKDHSEAVKFGAKTTKVEVLY